MFSIWVFCLSTYMRVANTSSYESLSLIMSRISRGLLFKSVWTLKKKLSTILTSFLLKEYLMMTKPIEFLNTVSTENKEPTITIVSGISKNLTSDTTIFLDLCKNISPTAITPGIDALSLIITYFPKFKNLK